MSDKNEFSQTTLLQASPINQPVGLSNRDHYSSDATPSPTPSLNPPPSTANKGEAATAGPAVGGPPAPKNNLYDKPGYGAETRIIPFWSENPNILLKPDYVFEYFPTDDMTYNQKLNAVSRLVILLTILTLVFTQNIRILFICIITLTAIYFLYRNHGGVRGSVGDGAPEGFQDRAGTVLNGFPPDHTQVFAPPTAENPFENVLLPDYDYNPQKKPAAASFNENIGDQILKQAKQLVLNANPDQPDLADKLFNDLGNQLVFEQSLQPFYSNPATTIPNDQEAFAEFCYGSMISCKEGNLFACARNLPNQALI